VSCLFQVRMSSRPRDETPVSRGPRPYGAPGAPSDHPGSDPQTAIRLLLSPKPSQMPIHVSFCRRPQLCPPNLPSTVRTTVKRGRPWDSVGANLDSACPSCWNASQSGRACGSPQSQPPPLSACRAATFSTPPAPPSRCPCSRPALRPVCQSPGVVSPGLPCPALRRTKRDVPRQAD